MGKVVDLVLGLFLFALFLIVMAHLGITLSDIVSAFKSFFSGYSIVLVPLRI